MSQRKRMVRFLENPAILDHLRFGGFAERPVLQDVFKAICVKISFGIEWSSEFVIVCGYASSGTSDEARSMAADVSHDGFELNDNSGFLGG